MGLCLLYDIAFVFSFEGLYEETEEFKGICEIITLKEEKEYTNKYVVKNIKNNTKIILYSRKDFWPGDILEITGEFSFAEESRNYGGFNYREYLKQSKIYGILYSENALKIDEKKDIYYFRGKILEKIFKKTKILYDEKINGFIDAILFGNKNNLTDEFSEQFKIANISHVLAISGMHISYVIYFVSKILENTLKNKKLENYILILFITIFWFFTGMSVSCGRAMIMTIISILSFIFKRKYNFYSSYFLSFFIIIILNPFDFFNIGMWLSYLGILGIKMFFEFFNKIFSHLTKKSNQIFESIYLSISAQILIFPIIIRNFNMISLTLLISNILVSFLIDKIMLLGYLSILFSFINLKSGLIFSNINSFLINGFMEIIENINEFPLSKIYLKTPYMISILLYYTIIFLISLYYKKNKLDVLRLFCSYKYVQIALEKIAKKLKKFSYIFIIFVLIFTSTYIKKMMNEDMNIHFVDVGQGDCTLIKTANGKIILIDGGEGNSEKYDYGKNVVLPYLLDRRIKKLDYIIISHFDSDHVGGIISLINEIDVKKIIIGSQFENSNNYEEFLKIASKKKIDIIVVKANDKIMIEKDCCFEVLWPNAENVINENTLNNNSLVCKLVYKNFSMLFTGDIEKIAEEAILKEYSENEFMLESTILKIAHHGSKTSSTENFLKAVNPQIALIGVGENNTFGHPANITLENLQKISCRVYRTDKDGEITIKTDGKHLKNVTTYINY